MPRGLFRGFVVLTRIGATLAFGVLCCNLYEGRSLQLFPELVDAGVECRDERDCPKERAFCANGACLECVVDANCRPGKRACAGNVCVECRVAEDCASNQVCNNVLSLCALACSEPSDCAGQAASRCSSELDLCVECVDDTDCMEPRKPACDRGGRCVECREDLDCTPDKPRCQSDRRTCVECLDSSECGGRVCDPKDFRCVDCLIDADCGVGGTCDAGPRRCRLPCAGGMGCDAKKPICDAASGLCIECTSDDDCKDPMRTACSPEHQCVECMNDDHCKMPGKRACITATERCGECTMNAHCPDSMQCDLQAARCAPMPRGPVGPGPAPGPTPAP